MLPSPVMYLSCPCYTQCIVGRRRRHYETYYYLRCRSTRRSTGSRNDGGMQQPAGIIGQRIWFRIGFGSIGGVGFI